MPWIVTAICETFKTTCRTGKLIVKGRFAEPFGGPTIPKSILGDSTQRRFLCKRKEKDPPYSGAPPSGEDLNDVLEGESDGSQPSDRQTDGTEALDDFESIFGNPAIYRHHAPPRV